MNAAVNEEETMIEMVKMHENVHVSDKLRQELVSNTIEPFYRETVQNSLRSNVFWKKA